jgi:hypothetical protein
MLRVSVVYLTVSADLYSAESSVYIDTHALFKVSGRSLYFKYADRQIKSNPSDSQLSRSAYNIWTLSLLTTSGLSSSAYNIWAF